MSTIKEAASGFLAKQRAAVTGVSRHPHGHGSNVVYTRLRERGYQVFAINPNADTVEGDPCYPGPEIGSGRDRGDRNRHPAGHGRGHCARARRAGHRHMWMRRRPGPRSVSRPATEYGHQHGLAVIDGGCPCTFVPTADLAHKVARLVFTATGNVPRHV